MIKELNTKTNEDLCTLIVRLKLQLLESRFKMAAGEIEKTHKIKEIRKTIAQALTVLSSRNIDLSIGTHGVTMYDRKNNTVKSITNLIDQSLEAIQEADKTKSTSKSTKKPTKTESVGKAIANATVEASKLEKVTDQKQNTFVENKKVSNSKLVSEKKTSSEFKRKVIGA